MSSADFQYFEAFNTEHEHDSAGVQLDLRLGLA